MEEEKEGDNKEEEEQKDSQVMSGDFFKHPVKILFFFLSLTVPDSDC